MSQTSSFAMLFVFFVMSASTANAASSSTPVDKVIQLLNKLSDKIESEGKEEATSYDKFACFCKAQADSKVKLIAEEEEQIKSLSAYVEEATERGVKAGNDAGIVRAQIIFEQEQANTSSAQRVNQTASYNQQKQELNSAIFAIGKATDAVKRSRGVTPTLLEVTDKAIMKVKGTSTPSVAAMLSKRQTGFLLQPADTTGMVTTGSNNEPAYQYKSDDLLSTLQTLQRQFKDDLHKLEMEEGQLADYFAKVEGAREMKIAAMTQDATEKETTSTEMAQKAQADQTSLTQTEAARSADQVFLDDLTAMCEAKADAWDTRSQERANELNTIAKAKELLKGMGNSYAVTGLVAKSEPKVNYKATVPAHGMIAKHPVLLQVSSAPGQHRQAVASFLEGKAKTLNSALLQSFARDIRVAGGHFENVKQLLQNLISKLEEDANNAAAEANFCDTQLKAAADERDQKQQQMESLAATVDNLTTAIAKIAKDISTIQAEIADLQQAKNEMTILRAEEKAQNEKTIADAEAGDAAVNQALSLMNQFYGTSLAQAKQEPVAAGSSAAELAPETFSGDYQKSTDEASGIKGLLEVISTDFVRTATEARSAETAAVNSFNEDQHRLEQDINTKQAMVQTLEVNKAAEEASSTTSQDDLKDATLLHSQALVSLENLKKSCAADAAGAEERQRAREQEIEALRQAMNILDQWS